MFLSQDRFWLFLKNTLTIALIVSSAIYSLLAQAPDFYQIWETYKEQTVQDKLFKHSDLVNILSKHQTHGKFEITEVGQSVEELSISLIRIGTGPKPILLWSQMHGDEPTATMAIFDLLNYFSTIDSLDDHKNEILEKLSIYIIPMLNPDGTEVYKRRNSLDIDLNRDAQMLESPESVILKTVRDSIEPVFGFNLHDQSPYYTVGASGLQAAFSFLAPAYDEAKSLNDTRANAMRLIVQLNRALQEYQPGRVGRFNDTFEPRAFGDNMQLWGTSTVLIESGYIHGDVHKQENRRLHFMLFLEAFESIANQTYLFEGLYPYFEIPFNNRNGFDLIIRKISVQHKGKEHIVDIAWNRAEYYYDQYRKLYFKSAIVEIGDLSRSVGFEEIDADKADISLGKVLKKDFKAIQNWTIHDILDQGYTHVQLKNLPKQEKTQDLPIHFIKSENELKRTFLIGRNPSFFMDIPGHSGRILISDGRKFDLDHLPEEIANRRIGDLF